MTQEHIETVVREQTAALSPFIQDVISQTELREKLSAGLRAGRPLRIKQGIDPTAPDVHIGHMVPYRLIRAFQDFGHTAVLIIGDVTARIGDPTDREAERAHLDEETVTRNARRYTEQIFRVVDSDRAEVRRQSEWYGRTGLIETVELLSKFSTARMLAHETFRKRLDSGKRLSLHELVYPVLQAQDSVAVRADVEIGGSDQRFNMLCGRDLLRADGMEAQVVITTPLLPGSDGRKMSKSFGNHIPVLSEPDEMFGKIMALSDDLMPEFYRLASGLPRFEWESAVRDIESGLAHPRDAKARLAEAVVATYHGIASARRAASEFNRRFREGGLPADIPDVVVTDTDAPLATVLHRAGLTSSSGEGRRLIQQGGVSCNGVPVGNPSVPAVACLGDSDAAVVRVGKRRFLRIRKL